VSRARRLSNVAACDDRKEVPDPAAMGSVHVPTTPVNATHWKVCRLPHH
jgi:hypothetical protein